MYVFIIICNYFYEFPLKREEKTRLVSERMSLRVSRGRGAVTRARSSARPCVTFHALLVAFVRDPHVPERFVLHISLMVLLRGRS